MNETGTAARAWMNPTESEQRAETQIRRPSLRLISGLEKTGGPLDQRTDGRSITSHFEEFAFPMTRDQAVGDFIGPVGDRRNIRELAVAIGPTGSWPTHLVRLTQGRSSSLRRVPRGSTYPT